MQVSWALLVETWGRMSPYALGGAAVLTVVSYAWLSIFDLFALRLIGKRFAYQFVVVTSFLAYCFNFNFGVLIGAFGLRYRLYGRLGLRPGDITRVTVYTTSAAFVGYTIVAGLALLTAPFEIPQRYDLPFSSTSAFGILLLAVAPAYLIACAFRRTPLRILRWRYELPTLKGGATQISLASIQWLLASTILWTLIPPGHGLDFSQILAVHLVAAVAGVITNVPAGYGILEGTFLLLLSSSAPPEVILGAILAYRVVYHLAPLCLACCLFFYTEHSTSFTPAALLNQKGQ